MGPAAYHHGLEETDNGGYGRWPSQQGCERECYIYVLLCPALSSLDCACSLIVAFGLIPGKDCHAQQHPALLLCDSDSTATIFSSIQLQHITHSFHFNSSATGYLVVSQSQSPLCSPRYDKIGSSEYHLSPCPLSSLAITPATPCPPSSSSSSSSSLPYASSSAATPPTAHLASERTATVSSLSPQRRQPTWRK